MRSLGRLGGFEVGDLLLAAGLTAFALLAANADTGVRHLDAPGYALTVVCCVAVAARRRWPVVVLAVCTLAFAVYLAGDYPLGWLVLPLMVAFYTVAVRGGRRLVLVGALMVAVAGAATWQLPGGWPTGQLYAATYGTYLLTWVALLAAAALAGEVVRYRRESALARAAAAEELLRRGAAEERLRLARELHDVVGHSMASIAVLSGAALHLLDDGPSPVREALTSIRSTSRDAVAEMRVTLGRLRADERPDAHPAEPAAGLDRLDDLLTAVRAAGVPVDLVRTGTVAPLAPAVDHAAYRIVQESLTNVLKHAGRGATATVRLVYESGGTVEVAVTDDGAGGPAGTGGHGLTGMRERAESVGGTLAAGPTGHGFAVSARLPCGERS